MAPFPGSTKTVIICAEWIRRPSSACHKAAAKVHDLRVRPTALMPRPSA
jgi:hypothetical protein